MKYFKNIFIAALLVVFGSFAAFAAGDGHQDIKKINWSWSGFFGKFDKHQLQRGFGIYKEVCASCHGLSFVAFRNLAEPGGPEFSVEQAKAIAGEFEYEDQLDDDGEPKARKGILADRFKPPFDNQKAARSANNGAYPPDLSLIVKGRTHHADTAPWYLAPLSWIKDIASGYEERGADYLYSLLVGYKDAPAGFKLNDGMAYNAAFPGHQIAMPSPLSAGSVSYADGSAETVDQYARDVTAFLAWTSEPHLNQRKKIGRLVLPFLIILSVLLYLLKRVTWSGIKH